MGEYFRGACLGPGGCDSSRPQESVWTGAKVLAAILTLSYYMGFLKVLFIYWPSRTAQGILILLPGIEPDSPALEGGLLTTGRPGKSLGFLL